MITLDGWSFDLASWLLNVHNESKNLGHDSNIFPSFLLLFTSRGALNVFVALDHSQTSPLTSRKA
jgi:hypothetical protein